LSKAGAGQETQREKRRQWISHHHFLLRVDEKQNSSLKNKVLSQKLKFFPTKTKPPLRSVGEIAARSRLTEGTMIDHARAEKAKSAPPQSQTERRANHKWLMRAVNMKNELPSMGMVACYGLNFEFRMTKPKSRPV
jgi:hypothetical protein